MLDLNELISTAKPSRRYLSRFQVGGHDLSANFQIENVLSGFFRPIARLAIQGESIGSIAHGDVQQAVANPQPMFPSADTGMKKTLTYAHWLVAPAAALQTLTWVFAIAASDLGGVTNPGRDHLDEQNSWL